MPSSVDMRFVTNTYCWSPSTVLSSTGRTKMDLFPASFSLNSTCKGSTYHCFLKSEIYSSYICWLIENIVPCHLDMLYCNLVVKDFQSFTWYTFVIHSTSRQILDLYFFKNTVHVKLHNRYWKDCFLIWSNVCQYIVKSSVNILVYLIIFSLWSRTSTTVYTVLGILDGWTTSNIMVLQTLSRTVDWSGSRSIFNT